MVSIPLKRVNVTDDEGKNTQDECMNRRRLAMTLPDRCEDVEEILRPFLVRNKMTAGIIKKDWRINHADYTIGRYRNIHR